MINQQTCAEPGCEVHVNAGVRNYKGWAYCEPHYWSALGREMNLEFALWFPGQEAPARFKYLLGRISAEQNWETAGDSYISSARIRDRAYRFTKTEQGCVFEITRHPGAFTHRFKKPVVQTWEADLPQKQLRLLNTRPWRKSDPDV